MTALSFTKTLVDGEKAYASDVESKFTELLAWSSLISNDNIKAAAGIAGSKLADGGIVAGKIGTGAVTTAKILAANVTAVKLADDGTEGNGCNLSETFTEVDQAWANPAETTGFKQHGGKTVWGWFYTSSTSAVTFDDSIDWRYRLVQIEVWAKETADPDDHIPNGASIEVMYGRWIPNGGSMAFQDASCGGIGYSYDGADEFLIHGFDSPGLLVGDHMVWQADGGALKVYLAQAPATGVAVLAKVSCSPYIGAAP